MRKLNDYTKTHFRGTMRIKNRKIVEIIRRTILYLNVPVSISSNGLVRRSKKEKKKRKEKERTFQELTGAISGLTGFKY